MGVAKSLGYADEDYMLYYVQRKEHQNIDKLLQKKTHLVNCRLTKNTKMTPLCKASLNGNMQLVKLLVQKWKADPSQATEKGQTPLISAIKKDRINVIRYLLEHGANPAYVTPQGTSTLDYAILPGFYSAALLISSYADQPSTRNAIQYQQLGLQNHYRYVNYQLLLSCLEKKIQPENVPDFLTKHKKILDDPVVDPRQTWKQWVKRQMQFKDPPLVERSQLPQQLQPQNRKFGKINYFLSKIALSPLSQEPNYHVVEKRRAESEHGGMHHVNTANHLINDALSSKLDEDDNAIQMKTVS